MLEYAGSGWEDLRKQACHLENEIDLKLVQFSKLGTTTHSSLRTHGQPTNSEMRTALQMSDHMAKDLQNLLSQLTQVNERMSTYMSQSVNSSHNAMLQHTLQRHWDILHDYSHEFQKIDSNVSSFRDREELLGSANMRDNRIGGSSTDLYLKEHEHLLSSDQLIDDQLGIASATKESLQSQKSALYGVSHKVNTIVNRFPAINSLIQRVNLYKRRDAIILAFVIASCLIFLLWYSLH